MMSGRGRRLAGLLLVVLLLLTAGCGKASKAEPSLPVEEPSAEPVVALTSWLNPTGVWEMVGAFQGLTYAFANIEDGVETDRVEVKYRLVGEETVEGKKTSKISFTVLERGGQEVRVLWLDADGEAVRFEVDGAPDDPTTALMVAEWLLWPFMTVEMYQVKDILTTGLPGYNVEVARKERVSFGSVAADVTTVKVSWSQIGGDIGYLWSVADFGKFQMLVDWEIDYTVGGEEEGAFTFRVTEVEAR